MLGCEAGSVRSAHRQPDLAAPRGRACSFGRAEILRPTFGNGQGFRLQAGFRMPPYDAPKAHRAERTFEQSELDGVRAMRKWTVALAMVGFAALSSLPAK